MTRAAVVTQSGFTSKVTLGEQTAYVTYTSTTARVDTMKGIQRHRGYLPKITFDRKTVSCGHRLHTKAKAARECGVKVAKRLLREAHA